MQLLPVPPDMLDRLSEHRTIGKAPCAELEWLIAHGRLRRLAAGEQFIVRGQRLDESDLGLEIVLTGHFGIHVDRGAGLRKVMEWTAGDVSGCPFSA
jgi:hypothetical protein